jgi:TadE-like protein
MLPIILILLLGAIDFGRLFLSWVTLHQAARIAANHAALDTTTTSLDIPDLIESETDGMNCAPGTPALQYTKAGVVTTAPELNDYAHVTLTCDFSLLTPLAGIFFGDPIPMTAVSSFPVRTGVLAGPGGGGPPPPPPPEQCRTIPDLEGMSIGGARLAWTSAGFVGSFTTSASDTETVEPDSIIITPLDPACADPLAIFHATIQVEALTPDPGPAGCEVVPNVIGMTLTTAVDAWDDSAFTGTLTSVPTPGDPDAVVTDQGTSPDVSEPGVTCLDPAADVEVTLSDPWPDPPVAPCQVPHLIDKTRPVGQVEWYGKGFAAGTFSPTNGSWKIKSQSLVGFSWAPCTTAITVSQQP